MSDIYAGVELIPLSFDGEDYPSDVNDMMAKGIEMNALHYFVADRRSGRIRSYRYSTGDAYLFPLIMYADADYAYAAMVKDDVESSPRLLMDMPDADSVMSTIEDESLILLKYRLKK